MHSLWNKCLQTGNKITMSSSSISTKQIGPYIFLLIILHVMSFSLKVLLILSYEKFYWLSFFNSLDVNPWILS